MPYQSVFRRYELKYMLTLEQKHRLVNAISAYMCRDKYGRTNIRNIYFDTDSYLLIRRSIEKPIYKEKLRIRSYSRASSDRDVFVELKKKYEGVVYKRRLALPYREAIEWVEEGRHCSENTQISREIDYFIGYYRGLRPRVFLSYEREAYYCKDGSDFRVTFDDTILAREEELTLDSEVYGAPLLPEGMVLMEIKCSGGMPLWMAHELSWEHVYKTSFSKYGTAYKNIILGRMNCRKITRKRENTCYVV